jgi:hypothetical protein
MIVSCHKEQRKSSHKYRISLICIAISSLNHVSHVNHGVDDRGEAHVDGEDLQGLGVKLEAVQLGLVQVQARVLALV